MEPAQHRQFIPQAARLSSRAAFVRHEEERGGLTLAVGECLSKRARTIGQDCARRFSQARWSCLLSLAWRRRRSLRSAGRCRPVRTRHL